MKTYQRVGCVNQHLGGAKFNAIITNIPGRQVRSDIFYRFNPREPRRKRLKIPLIREAISIDVVVTPFDTFAAPPFDGRNSIRIVSSSYPSDVVDPELSQFFELGSVTMRNNRECRIL